MSERHRAGTGLIEPGAASCDNEVIEVPLLLPGWQVSVLATAAHDHGLTAGEMVRSLLRDFIMRWQRSHPDRSDGDDR
jgi:hypothetical protein